MIRASRSLAKTGFFENLTKSVDFQFWKLWNIGFRYLFCRIPMHRGHVSPVCTLSLCRGTIWLLFPTDWIANATRPNISPLLFFPCGLLLGLASTASLRVTPQRFTGWSSIGMLGMSQETTSLYPSFHPTLGMF